MAVLFNLGSAKPKGSAKIFLGSAKYLNILLFYKSLSFVRLVSVSLGTFCYFRKVGVLKSFFEGNLGSGKFILVILGSATIKRLKITGLWYSIVS
jgi:hypothetical protein